MILFFVILFLFIILYLRYKFNKSIKKTSNLASKEIEINYIRNQDIINNEIVSVNDDIKSDHQFDDNILNKVKQEINIIENDSLQPINFGKIIHHIRYQHLIFCFAFLIDFHLHYLSLLNIY